MKLVMNAFLTIVFLIGMGSCATMDIDRSADFSQYKSFGWGKADIRVTNPVYDSDLINKNIKNTIEKEFAKRGIALKQDHPDFVVNYYTYTEKKQQQSYYGGGYGYPFFPGYYPFFRYGWGFPMMGYGWGGMPSTYTYTEGTLIIDVKDRRTDETIWRGIVSGNINSLGNLEKQVSKGIRAIMKKYPITPQAPLPAQRDKAIS